MHHWVRGRWKLPTSADRGDHRLPRPGAMPSGRSFEGWLYKISRGVMCALKPGACRLGGLVPPPESVKDGVREALNRVWERRRKLRQRPPFSAAFPQIRQGNITFCSIVSSY